MVLLVSLPADFVQDAAAAVNRSREAMGRFTKIEIQVEEHPIGLGEGDPSFGLVTFHRGRVGNAPVGGHGLAGPKRTDFLRPPDRTP